MTRQAQLAVPLPRKPRRIRRGMPRHYNGNGYVALRLELRIAARTHDVDQNLLWFVGEGLRAFVAHLGELFDGALLDFLVVGFEQLAPDFEEIDARMNFFDEIG